MSDFETGPPAMAERLRPVGDILMRILGYVLAAIFLLWIFHDIHFGEFWSHMKAVRWPWVVLGVALDTGGYVCMGIRWRFLLQPLGPISAVRTTQAVYAGLFVSEVLPLRLGELARMYLVSRWLAKDFFSIVPSVALERLFEGLWMVVGIGLTAAFVPLPKSFLRAGDILGGLLLLAAILFIVLVFRKPKSSRGPTPRQEDSPWKILDRARRLVDKLITGFRGIGLTRSFYLAFFLTLLMFAMMALAFWAILLAYGMGLSFWAGAAVFLIIHFGTALPNAPANVGSYQFFCIVGLTLFGIEKTQATAFSVAVFLLLTIPLWVLGFFALGKSGMTLSTIRDKLKTLRKNKETNF